MGQDAVAPLRLRQMKPRLRLSSTKPKPILSVIPNGLQRHSFAHSRVNGAADTVNPDEIAHFSRLSEHWWDENGEFSMLHKMNPIRVEFIRDRVRRVREDEGSSSTGLTGLDVLDVGCGGGLLSEVSIHFELMKGFLQELLIAQKYSLTLTFRVSRVWGLKHWQLTRQTPI